MMFEKTRNKTNTQSHSEYDPCL